MKPGEERSPWQNRITASGLLVLAWLGLAGCTTSRTVEKNLHARQAISRQKGVAENYALGCPDVLQVTVPTRPSLTGQYAVGPEGRIKFGDYEVRVDGKTVPEVKQLIGEQIGYTADAVDVAVKEYRSQYLILFGAVTGEQRVVPYHGQETVLDLLQRTGGLSRGAAPDHVYVVRSHVDDGRRPEIFHIDLASIVMKKDHRSNLRLQPFDQVYVGETRQCRIEKVVPPWLRPFYQTFWDIRPESGQEPAAPQKTLRWLTPRTNQNARASGAT